MKINILLPFKEKFDEDKASSVSITVKNNLYYSDYLKDIEIFGQNVDKPLFKKNFRGFKYSFFSFKSKNNYLADQMIKSILNSKDKKQLIEIHNRPYLVDQIAKKINNYPIILFLHNDPKTMKGSQSVLDRKNILKKCEAVLCVSEYIKKQFLDGIKTKHKKVNVLYNGVSRKLKRFPKKKKEILFVGRLVKEKGVELYINAAESILVDFPDWSFGLIGSTRLGSNNANSYSLKLINKINKINYISNQFKFYGFKDYNFVQEKMKNASIVTIPSLWQEPFGLVAAEAMSNGAAIIASKVGGIPEILEDNGILIKNINHFKLEGAMRELMNDNSKMCLLQKKAWKNFKLTSINSSKKLDDFRGTILQSYF